LFHKTRIRIGIDSKTQIGIDSGKQELELIPKTRSRRSQEYCRAQQWNLGVSQGIAKSYL
jgi:hypothetical protein